MSQHSIDNHKEKAVKLIGYTPLFLAVVLWCILTFKEHYYLMKVEDLSVFLFDRMFIMENFRIPGGFLGLAGSFLTQFLHLPWLGALIWVSLLLLAFYLTIRVFRIPDDLRPLAAIPVALLIIGNMSLGYGVFIMRGQDHFFAPVLGYLAALIPVAVAGRIKTIWSRSLLIVIWITAGYMILGTFAFTGALAAACATLVRSDLIRKQRITFFVLTATLIIVVPLVIYPIYTSFRMADSWFMGLPSISVDDWTRAMRAPFQLSLLCQIILATVSVRLSAKPLSLPKSLSIRSAIYIIAIASVWAFWFKDENFHTELAMSEAVDRYDWNSTVRIFSEAANSHADSDAKVYAARTKETASANSTQEIADIVDRYNRRFFEPTRTMVLYRDLALLKMDRALDEAFTMKDGGRHQKSRTQIPMTIQSGKQLYFQYGLPNLCYRWCIEDAVEHDWSAGTLRYMSVLSILTGEKEMAVRFLDKLDKTLFYRKWSRQNRALLDNSELVAKTTPYNTIIPLMCYEDNMTNDLVKCESHLIKHFSRPRPAEATPLYDLTALFWAMRTQSIPDFWERFYYFLQTNQSKTLPRSIQEAAILYNSLENHGVELSFETPVKESYDRFTQYVQRHPVRTIKESSYPYSQQFGKTFFYYYYFIRDLQTY